MIRRCWSEAPAARPEFKDIVGDLTEWARELE